MRKKLENSNLLRLLAFFTIACGPRIDDGGAEEADAAGAADVECEESSCPISCGDRSCAGALGIGRCVDDKCSPRPMECVVESRTEKTCAEVCQSVGGGVVCVENGCEGATAFGYPGPEHLALGYCGDSTPSVRDAVTAIAGPCSAPLAFAGEGSFELYQCCCDDPEH